MDTNVVKFDPHKEDIEILVVDCSDDRELYWQLQFWKYQVTKHEDFKTALIMLMSGEKKFDIAMINVDGYEAEGYDLIKITSAMNIFTIQISYANRRYATKLVKDGISSGADLFLPMPIRYCDSSCLWQHVYSKMFHEHHQKYECKRSNDANNSWFLRKEQEAMEFYPRREAIHVLVVESDSRMRGLVHDSLLVCDYQVTAVDFDEASNLLANGDNKFDIVMVDVIQNKVQGFDFIKMVVKLKIFTIQTLTAFTECVVGDDDNALIKEGIECGADLFMLKPFQLDPLYSLWQHVYFKKIREDNVKAQERKQSDCSREISEILSKM